MDLSREERARLGKRAQHAAALVKIAYREGEAQIRMEDALAEMTAEDLGRERSPVHVPAGPPRARTYDVFGTANFFNFKPWAASVEYLLKQDIDRIAIYDGQLVEQFIGGIDTKKYDLTSPASGPARSTIVFISHRDPGRNQEIQRKLRDAGIEVAYRKGQLRFSPHLYNTSADIEKALAVLNAR